MGLQLPTETIISMMGFEDDIQKFKTSNISHHNVVHTDSDGTTRSIHMQIIKKPEAQGLSIRADYLLHGGQNFNFEGNIFEIECDNFLEIENVSILGKQVTDISERQIFKIIKGLRDRVGERKEWTNFIGIISKFGMENSVPNDFNWPGIAPNGEVKAIQPHKIESESEPVFPALFLPSILGCGPEAYSGEKEKTYSFHVVDPQSGDDILMNYQYQRGKTRSDIKESCTLTRIRDDEWESYPLYELQACLDKENHELGKIKSFKIHHANAADGKMDKVDFNNQKSLAVALKSVRMMNRVVRGGEKAFRDDQEKTPENRRLYMPSDIFALTGLNDVMMPQTPAPKRGRFCFTPMGGQATTQVFSEGDLNIGGNSYRFDYYPPLSTEKKTAYIDAGIQFGDIDKDGLTAKMMNYFEDIQNAEFGIITHGHEDHVGGLPYAVKFNYKIPLTLMTPDCYDAFKDGMRRLGVRKHKIEAALDRCVVVNVFENPETDQTIPIGATKDNPYILKKGGQKIELYWEYIQDDNLQTHRYPAGKCGDFEFSMCLSNHSLPGFAVELKTSAGGIVHLGDFRDDSTAQFNPTPPTPWLQNRESQYATLDATGADRPDDMTTPSQNQVVESLATLMKENDDRAWVMTGLGSSVQSMTSLIAAMGKHGRQYLLIEGRALNLQASRFNKMADLKKWAKNTHGVEIVTEGSKKTLRRIYDEEPSDNYAVYVTGSQGEPTSVLKRLIVNWLNKYGLEFTDNHSLFFLNGLIPVGRNAQERKGIQYLMENFHGGRAYLPEVLADERPEVTISASGHASPADMKKTLSQIQNLKSVAVIHGNSRQLSAAQKIVEDLELQCLNASNFENYDLKSNGNASLFLRESRDMMAIQTHLSNPLEFWLARDFAVFTAPTPVNDPSTVGTALKNFKESSYTNIGVEPPSLSQERARFHLSRTFNMSAQGGFLTGRYKFGIEKLEGSVWDEKAIGVTSAFDTETTGTDERFDFIDQFSMTSYSLKRKRIKQVELKQKIPDYTTPNPEALLVTVTSPDEKDDKALHPVLFADAVVDALKHAKTEAKILAKKRLPTAFQENPSTRAKILLVAHNFPFDDRQLKALFKDTLSPAARPHATNGVIGVDTLHVARAIHAIYPDKFKVKKYPDSDYLNFTLQALCEENGVPYDLSKAHNSALYDSERAMKLFWKMQDVAPDIVDQMVFNADSSKGHLLNDMIGHDGGVNGPHPVFSYLSRRRDRTDIQMGAFVGTIDNGSKAVILNLSSNPQDILSLSADEIADRLADRNDDSLEVVDLRQNPMVFSAKYFYERNTSKVFPRETFDRRARMVKEYLNDRDTDSMMNIHDRLLRAWDDKKMPILLKYNIIGDREPDLMKPSVQVLKDAENYKQSMRNDAVRSAAKKSFNPPAQNTLKAVKGYREILVEYLSVTPNQQKRTIGALNKAYREVMKESKPSEGQKYLVANLHYDIAPNAMEAEHIKMIENDRALHTKTTLDRAINAMERLKNEPGHFEKMVGRSLNKRRIYNALQEKINVLKTSKNYDEGAAKEAVTPWKLSA